MLKNLQRIGTVKTTQKSDVLVRFIKDFKR